MGLLRILLALSVMTGHANKDIFGFKGLYGNIAVQCFFMISGFYMALVLNEKYTQPKSYFTFIQQRFLRIYPAYYVIAGTFLVFEGLVSLGWPCGTLANWYQHANILSSFVVTGLAVINLTIFGQDYSTFFSLDPANGKILFLSSDPHAVALWTFLLDPPVWSVGIELTFYLVAPFLVRRSLRFQAALFLIVFTARVWVDFATPNSRPFLYFFAPLQLNFFIAGSIGYLFYRSYKLKLEAVTRPRPWIVWTFAAIVILYNRLPQAHHLYPYFMVLAFVMIPVLFAATSRNRTDRLVGELSYPFYLIHYYIILLMNPFDAPKFAHIYGPVCALTTMALAYLCYRYVEIYTERFRERLFVQKQKGALSETAVNSIAPAISR